MSDILWKLIVFGTPTVLLVSTLIGMLLGEWDRRREERGQRKAD